MKQIVSIGIVLGRTNYGEADRILTILTPDHGKIKVIAKGVRKVKSKLAGGIEFFSQSQISFIKGKKEIDTLISTRLLKNYSNISKSYERTMLGYDLIKQLNKSTEDGAEREYYNLTKKLFETLDDLEIPGQLCRFWFELHLLALGGLSPELQQDSSGANLQEKKLYNFDSQNMKFVASEDGLYGATHIKLLRLGARLLDPHKLAKIQLDQKILNDCLNLVDSMLRAHIRI